MNSDHHGKLSEPAHGTATDCRKNMWTFRAALLTTYDTAHCKELCNTGLARTVIPKARGGRCVKNFIKMLKKTFYETYLFSLNSFIPLTEMNQEKS